jgi:hypothetical protein
MVGPFGSRERRAAKSSSFVRITVPLADSVRPKLRVIRLAQSDFVDVTGLMARLGQQQLEPGRELRVDENFHRSTATRMGWSASAAAKARQAPMSSLSR